MKRRKLLDQSIPPASSPWRWSIGGPITDFGEDGIEAGPSCARHIASDAGISATRRRTRPSASPSTGLLQLSSTKRTSQPNLQPTQSLPRRRSRAVHAITAALALSSAFTPLATAGPVPTTTTPATPISITPTQAPTVGLYPRRLNADPEYLTPTSLPPVTTITLPESVLPYYLTQSSDGGWYKADNPWWLYGRVASQPDRPTPTASDTLSPTAAGPPTGYAVISVLPKGWGVENTRSSFYRTPLIVTASVILALLIVAAIVFVTIRRRKLARRRKRHEQRMRRKALAAAGLTEDDVREGGAAAEELFKQRLEELERQHLQKRRARTKNGQATFVRTKVRVWHKTNVRKRKNAASPNEDADDEKPDDDVASHMASSFTASQTSLASSISSDGRRRRSAMRQIADAPPQALTASSSNQSPDTLVSSDEPSSPASGPSNSPSIQAQSSSDQASSQTQAQSSDAAGEVPSAYGNLPPAYRPASIHGREGEASGSSQSSALRNAAVTAEKVAATGFYPAPATAEAEAAQAVAHRADAKAPVNIPADEDQARERHHVATDDKRALERLRLGASAPPVARVDGDAGPSAPHIEVDDSGFETLPVIEEDEGPSIPFSAPGMPAPPAPAALRSLHTFDGALERDISTPLSDPSHLVPSAPPMLANDNVPSAPPMPSAPPPEDDVDDVGSSPQSATAPPAPSAPPMETEEAETDELAGTPTLGETEEEDEHAGDMAANLGVNGHKFLPRYEP